MIPLVDEEDSLPERGRRLQTVLDAFDGPSEAILVDDGSRDSTMTRRGHAGRGT